MSMVFSNAFLHARGYKLLLFFLHSLLISFLLHPRFLPLSFLFNFLFCSLFLSDRLSSPPLSFLIFLKTEFLTITSLSGQPLFCIAAGRQSDGQFRLRMRDNIRVRRSFACGHIANCIQNVLYGQLKEPKKEGNNANFCDKIFISLREKNEILKLLSNFAFLRTYVCS